MFDQVRPTTLSGIKTLAKDIKRSGVLTHARALDQASAQAGFQNWPHAVRALAGEGRAATAPRHPVWVSVPWRDQATRARGVEVQPVSLSKPLRSVVTQAQIAAGHYTGSFRIVADDHLADSHQTYSVDRARTDARRVARTLQFIDATGLVPSRGISRFYPNSHIDDRIPGADHYSGWRDPETKALVFVDEPYGPAEGASAIERAEWASKWDRTIVKPDWPGMYNPDGGAVLFLIAPSTSAFDLTAAAAALDRLDRLPEVWDGLSVDTAGVFRSPAEKNG